MLKRLKDKLRSYLTPEKQKELWGCHKAFLCIFALNLLVFLLDCKFDIAHKLALRQSEIEPFPSLTGLLELITCMFAHEGFMHFFGNFLFVTPFALYLERKVGSNKFLLYWLVTGIGGSICFIYTPHFFPWGGVLGASGACSGIMAAACLYADEDRFTRLIALTGLLIFFMCQLSSGIAAAVFPLGVAYMAHAGGMITAILIKSYDAKDSLVLGK